MSCICLLMTRLAYADGSTILRRNSRLEDSLRVGTNLVIMKYLRLVYLVLQECFRHPLTISVIDPDLFKVVREDGDKLYKPRPSALKKHGKRYSRTSPKTKHSKVTKRTLLKG